MTSVYSPPLSSYTTGEVVIPTDIQRVSDLIVNLYFVGDPLVSRQWTMVDAGLPFSAGFILKAAEKRYGRHSRPNAIVLTHGHFDHVGALKTLAEKWDVPIWAHELEAPYLDGRSSYPPPDPTVGGGMMARLSPLYPAGPIDISHRLQILPADGSVPPLPGWRWIHTPGHTPGHISLFREGDRTLIAGDAFVTTKQESVYDAITKPYEMHGPPAYFTSDWTAAWESVQRLAGLRPALALTGHGLPVSGKRLTQDLDWLLMNFDRIARPHSGRYVNLPDRSDRNGVVSVPPPAPDPVPMLIFLGGFAAAVAIVLATRLRSRRQEHDELLEAARWAPPERSKVRLMDAELPVYACEQRVPVCETGKR